MPEIKLYGYSTSPFVRKVACFLYYKNLDFEFVPVNPLDSKEISFTSQTQVPVLSIDGEWRTDSSSLGVWLDELFPEKSLLGSSDSEREKILEIDEWVSDRFITSTFRFGVDLPMNLRFRQIGWRLSSIVSSQSPLTDEQKNYWPQLLKEAPFILAMTKDLDRSESLKQLRYNLMRELIEHLGKGPYLGGLSTPSLADFGVYQLLVFGYLVGLEEKLLATTFTEVKAWIEAMSKHLPENPILVPDYMIVHSIVDALAKKQTLPQRLIQMIGSERTLSLLAKLSK